VAGVLTGGISCWILSAPTASREFVEQMQVDEAPIGLFIHILLFFFIFSPANGIKHSTGFMIYLSGLRDYWECEEIRNRTKIKLNKLIILLG
jgi:hypothetical protein